jgi:iron complex transport system permease protein
MNEVSKAIATWLEKKRRTDRAAATVISVLALSSGVAVFLLMTLLIYSVVALVGGAIILFSQRNAFRALTLGEETAQSLGVDVARLRLVVITGVALGVGGAVAVTGTIGFIGLVAPHLMRPLIGHDPARLLVPSALAGSALLLAADIAVRIIPSTSDIKVGVLTSIIGVPFFLYLIARERRALGGGVA